MVEFYSAKAPHFLSSQNIFVLLILDFYNIFYANKNRTIEYFKLFLWYICVKSIL